jgi:hypothetical protein
MRFRIMNTMQLLLELVVPVCEQLSVLPRLVSTPRVYRNYSLLEVIR